MPIIHKAVCDLCSVESPINRPEELNSWRTVRVIARLPTLPGVTQLPTETFQDALLCSECVNTIRGSKYLSVDLPARVIDAFRTSWIQLSKIRREREAAEEQQKGKRGKRV